MKISIIIPLYNSEKSIVRALDSVVNQIKHGFDVEIIVIDDASDDCSFKLVELFISNYSGEFTFKVVKNSLNQGVSKSRNLGVSLSSGDYIAFLDSDDRFHENKLAIIEPLLANNSIDFLFHSFSHESSVVNKASALSFVKLNMFFPFVNLVKNLICTPCVIVKNNTDYRFNESMTHMEDLELWTSIMLKPKINIYQLKEKLTILGHVANEGDGLSSNRSAMRSMELVMFLSLANKFLSVKLLLPVYYIIHKIKSILKD
ncbi:glycosyltransferase family 2 protein [Amphritea sp.]|uniref:glycosyltransferase family 2 protein n=1 Tax=Amphritea sp. TaxID=1872502 RepID=UPI0025BEEAB5|nr:glycosyltransferase family 2 protein [Amphritea sp.]